MELLIFTAASTRKLIVLQKFIGIRKKLT